MYRRIFSIGVLVSGFAAVVFAQDPQKVVEVEKPARSVMTGSCAQVVLPAGQSASPVGSCSFMIPGQAAIDKVPAGKVYVVEDAQVHCSKYYQDGFANVSLSTSGYVRDIPTVVRGTNNGIWSVVAGAEKVAYYVQPNQMMKLTFYMLNPAQAQASCSAIFSGYLVSQ